MSSRLALVAVALVLAGGCATGYSPYPPPRKGGPKLWVPRFTTSQLPNGVELSITPDPYLPMAAIAVGVRGGYLQDPPGKEGVTRLLATLMTTRAGGVPRLKLAGAYDLAGGAVRAEVTPDGIIFRIEVLEDRVDASVAMLAHILRHPDFDPDEIERLRDLQRSYLTHLVGDPDEVALQGLRQLVFGSAHPAGLPSAGTARSLAGLTVEDLRARYQQSFRPDNVAVGVSGRVDVPRIQETVQRIFGRWQRPTTPIALGKAGPGPEPASRKAIHYLARPGLSQTVICVGSRGLPQGHANHHLLRMIAGRVPASASAWLRGMEQVTYGVRSIDEASTATGLYGATFSVDAAATGRALESILGRYDAQPEGSFDIEKVVVLTWEGSEFFTIAGRAHHVASLFVRGLPIDHFTQLRQRLDDHRGRELPEMILEYLRSDRMQVVLVGDPEVIESQVRSLGKGELRRLALAFE